MSKAEVLGHLEEQHDGFHGYGLRMLREVKLEEILPDNWQPTLPTVRDGDPAKFRSLMPESFALWAIYERMPNLDDFHGPNRFSVLHLCGDGVATYEALYNAQRVQPDVIAIIGAGTESGQNWTDFRDDQQILARVAFQNKGGKPRYLLQEHCESGSYWRAYERDVEQWTGPGSKYVLYACDSAHPDDDDDCCCCGIERHRYETYQRAEHRARNLRRTGNGG